MTATVASPSAGAVRAARRQALAGRAAWLLLAIPLVLAVWTVRAVVETYTPVPFQDQWDVLWWWRKTIFDGHFPLDYLFAQHNEHRIFFPRLVFFADLLWFRGTNVLDLCAIGAIQLAGAALFLRTAALRTLQPVGVAALAVALAVLASLAQYQNFFWAFQVQFVGVYAAGAWAIYLFCLASPAGAAPRWGVLAGAMALLAVAAFNMSNGFLAGFAMVMVGLATARSRIATAVAGAVTLALLAIFLHGFKAPPAGGTQTVTALSFAAYVLAYLGNLWAVTKVTTALAVGSAAVGLTLAMGVVVLRQKLRDPARVAMVGIVLFIGLSAGITALGRASYGVEQALNSRYMTPSAWFWAAQAMFWGLTAQASGRGWAKWLTALVLIAALAGLYAPQKRARTELEGLHQAIVMAGSAMVGGLEAPASFPAIYPEAKRVAEITPFLRDQQLSLFARDPGYRLGAQLPTDRVAAQAPCQGAFDAIAPEDNNGANWKVMGWGWDPLRHSAFERIVVVDPAGRIVGVALGGIPRKDVHKALHEVGPQSGWLGLAQPAPGQELTAYGVTRDSRLCPLGKKAAP